MLYIAKITPKDTDFSKFHVFEALSKNPFFLSFSLPPYPAAAAGDCGRRRPRRPVEKNLGPPPLAKPRGGLGPLLNEKACRTLVVCVIVMLECGVTVVCILSTDYCLLY